MSEKDVCGYGQKAKRQECLCHMSMSEVNKLEERYAYYRRCQQFRRNGEQCKAPAMRGEPLCYKHGQQAEVRRRRARFVLPPLTDFRGVQAAISQVAKAIIDNQIDEDHAGQLLDRIQKASLALRGYQGLKPRTL